MHLKETHYHSRNTLLCLQSILLLEKNTIRILSQYYHNAIRILSCHRTKFISRKYKNKQHLSNDLHSKPKHFIMLQMYIFIEEN